MFSPFVILPGLVHSLVTAGDGEDPPPPHQVEVLYLPPLHSLHWFALPCLHLPVPALPLAQVGHVGAPYAGVLGGGVLSGVSDAKVFHSLSLIFRGAFLEPWSKQISISYNIFND